MHNLKNKKQKIIKKMFSGFQKALKTEIGLTRFTHLRVMAFKTVCVNLDNKRQADKQTETHIIIRMSDRQTVRHRHVPSQGDKQTDKQI